MRLLPICLGAVPVILLCASASGTGRPICANDGPTFAGEAATLLFRHCTPCHRPNAVGPFSLLTYADAARRSQQIAEVVRSGAMPPWKADSHGEFKNERRLSEADRKTLLDWCAKGAPSGNLQDAPSPPIEPESGWRLGKPDLVVQMQQPYRLGAEGKDVYRCFLIPNPAERDVFISAVDFNPGAKTAVHHVNLFVDLTGQAKKLDELSEEPGFSSAGGGPGFPPSAVLGGWVPGRTTGHLPEGVGVFMPKGGTLVMEVHYHKTGKPEVDRTTAAIYFSKTPVQRRLRVISLMHQSLRVPANRSNYTVEYGTSISQDITLLDVTPHMHLLGKSMKVTALQPGKDEQPLVHVPKWDYRWQTVYEFMEPRKLKRGTLLSVSATYDNSTGNPLNPFNPPQEVVWGESATEEMCTAFLGFTVDAENLLIGRKIPPIHPYESRVP